MQQYICVYAASSLPEDPIFMQEAEQLGAFLARAGYGLCYGGGEVGLMGAVARAVHAGGGRVLGVIPEALNVPGIVYSACDELIVTSTMRQRKQAMEDASAGFIALPGGFGTFEELLEIITLKQLRYHNKPIVLLNTQGYYSSMIMQFEAAIAAGMARADMRALYHVADSPQAAMDYVKTYKPGSVADKLAVKHRI